MHGVPAVKVVFFWDICTSTAEYRRKYQPNLSKYGSILTEILNGQSTLRGGSIVCFIVAVLNIKPMLYIVTNTCHISSVCK
jgi:hypothetical protein